MKNYIYTGIFTLLTSLATPAFAERPELGNLIYTYGSCAADPATVSVLRIGPKADKQFLVQISGIDHELNGKVLMYKAKDLHSNKLQFSLLNEKDGKIVSSLAFDGSDQKAKLYINGYTGLYTPSGKLPSDTSRRLCLSGASEDFVQYYRLYEIQQADAKKNS